jgi:hypothetical protein
MGFMLYMWISYSVCLAAVCLPHQNGFRAILLKDHEDYGKPILKPVNRSSPITGRKLTAQDLNGA